MIRRFGSMSYFMLFLLFFSYATAAALLFQHFFLPLAGGDHYGQGLIQGDSAYFHSQAVELADRIRAEGWGVWSAGVSGNVSLLAALYVWFGDAPALMVPINAGLHALAAILIVTLGPILWPGRVGSLAGLLAAVLFVVFPSALNWYGQIHKDGFAIAGLLLMLVAWFWSEKWPLNIRSAAWISTLFLIGCSLIMFVRPYGLRLTAVGFSVMAIVELLAIWGYSPKHLSPSPKFFQKAFLLILLVLIVFIAPKKVGDGDIGYTKWTASRSNSSEVQLKLDPMTESILQWRWQTTAWIPTQLDGVMENIARTRIGLIEDGLLQGAASIYDKDRLPAKATEVLSFIPRALQIATFAPFPSRWLENLNVTRLVSVGEMLIWYLIAPGVLLLFYYRSSPPLLAVATLAIVMLTIYGVGLANVGTLYRIRYPYLFLLILLGLIGWLEYFKWRGWLSYRSGRTHERHRLLTYSEEESKQIRIERSSLVSSGVIVAAITTFSFLGLFVRDVIMAQMFGLSGEFDAYVMGTLIPMFLVTVISIPIGIAIVPFLLATQQIARLDEAYKTLRHQPLFLNGAGLIKILAALFGLILFSLISLSLMPAKTELVYQVSFWMLAIFIISGFLTIANGVLNAIGHYFVPATAQAVVPIIVIISLLGLGKTYGVIVVPIAMFAGQLLNLFILHRALISTGVGYPLIVETFKRINVRNFTTQYLPLVAAAVFMAAVPFIGTAMASTLKEGSIAALMLGGKTVLFISGLTGTAFASVVLPYFARYLAQHRLLHARQELSFLLLAGTIISIPLSFALHVISPTFIRFLFEGGAFGKAETDVVASVMAYGILQFPFFIVNLLLLKFAIAKSCSGKVMLTSIIGLFICVLFGMILMNRMGVAGISLAMTLSVAGSSLLLLLIFCRLGDVYWRDMLFICANWGLFATAIICLNLSGYIGVAVAVFTYVILMLGEFGLVPRLNPKKEEHD
jgi:putative peptidoglycan lipid II flippase